MSKRSDELTKLAERVSYLVKAAIPKSLGFAIILFERSGEDDIHIGTHGRGDIETAAFAVHSVSNIYQSNLPSGAYTAVGEMVPGSKGDA